MSASLDEKNKRPLSPHLQVYKPQMTSVLSIFHRFTGLALVAGTLMIAWWLIAAATGPEAYAYIQDFTATPFGTLLMLGWSVALFYHLCNGVRHLIWDTGHLFEIKNAYRAGYIVLLATVVLTGSVWYCALTQIDETAPPASTQTLVENTIEEGAAR